MEQRMSNEVAAWIVASIFVWVLFLLVNGQRSSKRVDQIIEKWRAEDELKRRQKEDKDVR